MDRGKCVNMALYPLAWGKRKKRKKKQPGGEEQLKAKNLRQPKTHNRNISPSSICSISNCVPSAKISPLFSQFDILCKHLLVSVSSVSRYPL